jgi:3-hydroxybutyryl-CoA dehydrogenase
MTFTEIGVVGAGVMGRDLAQNLAECGLSVILVDVSEKILNKALTEITESSRLSLLFKKNQSQVEPDKLLAKIKITTKAQDLSQCHFLVENITENEDLKMSLYPSLEEILPPDTVMAVNTSVISVTRLSSGLKNPQRVLGMHFMNPVHLKPVVEVIRGVHTSDETLAKALAFLKTISKKGIVVADSPGFVSNRVLMLTINEAIWVVADKVAEAREVDRLFRSCFGHAMGPLETGDLIGLDTILYSLEGLLKAYGDPKFRPCPLLRRMVEAGWLGKKSGRGFYEYQV